MLTENLNQTKKQTFHQILESGLNSKFNPRSPKFKITGVLTPIHVTTDSKQFKFKIVTDTSEYYLKLNSQLQVTAKKIEWEEVTVRGTLNECAKVIKVERLTLNNSPYDMAS